MILNHYTIITQVPTSVNVYRQKGEGGNVRRKCNKSRIKDLLVNLEYNR